MIQLSEIEYLGKTLPYQPQVKEERTPILKHLDQEYRFQSIYTYGTGPQIFFDRT